MRQSIGREKHSREGIIKLVKATEQQKQQMKEYHQKNKERIHEKQKEWRIKNRFKIMERLAKNEEKIKKKRKEYCFKNKLILNEKRKKYKKELFNVRASTKYYIQLKPECEICGSIEKLQRHHWRYDKPLLVNTLCKTCHSIQHVKNFYNSKFVGGI